MAPQQSKTVHDFWKNIYGDIDQAIGERIPEIATVGAMSSGQARLTPRGESYDPNAELLPVLSLYPPKAGDAVASLRLADGSQIVLGSIAQAAEPDPLSQGQADALYVPFGSYFIPQWKANFATGATVGSSTNTAAYVVALSISFAAVPAGTYTVLVHGSAIFKHTVAAANMDFQARVDIGAVTTGTNKTLKVHDTANTEMRLGLADEITGITRGGAGVLNVDLTYKPSTAGTLSCRNAELTVLIMRTA